MGRWIVFGCVAVILCGAAWYFGKPEPVILPTHVVAVAEPPHENVPQAPPSRVVEVVDLARAYEPVPDREEVLPGGVDTAAFIQVPEAAERIPPAIDLSGVEHLIGESASGAWLFGAIVPTPERIDVMPRTVPAPPSSGSSGAGELIFVPMGVPFTTGIADPIPPITSIANGLLDFVPMEALKVMPREVRLEKLRVMPREIPIQREELERCTGVRDDDFIGRIGP